MNYQDPDTICAIATPPGQGAIAVIRLSGPESLSISESIFIPKNKKLKLSEAASHTLHFGAIGTEEDILDEVLISIFREPNSYTGENAVEISCHGSSYIQQKILELLLDRGARNAKPGEFTMRAFLNGRFDLSQAEAVADLIAASSKTSHDLALQQMRGGFSMKIKDLRQKLLDFASLIELELDFSEEDVEFADRSKLKELLDELKEEMTRLVASFSFGNVIKTGIPVAIVGQPNVGKSTLLNALLNEDRALVSEIPGTTRDTVEDVIAVGKYTFRFIDTAGLRHSSDIVESMGIERTYEKINLASIVLFVFDVSETSWNEINEILIDFREHINLKQSNGKPSEKEIYRPEKKFILIANKTDKLVETPKGLRDFLEYECIFTSAKRKENINIILDRLEKTVGELDIQDRTVVSNVRHYEALKEALKSVDAIQIGMQEKLSGDLLTVDIRTALHHLGEISGEITTDEILGNIFGKFCIGK